VPIDIGRHCDSVLFAEGLDPHAAGIVDMTGDHADGAARRAGHLGFPKVRGQMLDQKDRDAIVGFPRAEDRIPQVKRAHTTPPQQIRIDRNEGGEFSSANTYPVP